jgi:hypothetical protein
MMSVPLYAAENKQDSEMTAHDYILDRQQSFNCSMVQLNDDELSAVTAAGFSSFTLNDQVAKAYFNIETSTFTEIQSLKMGYYNNGWDENWTNVSLGSSTQDLVSKDLYIEAGFSNISDSAKRTLEYLRVGTLSMTGPISADFNSFSGHIGDGNGGGVDYSRQNLGHKTITSNNDEFYMQLSRAGTLGAPAGWWFFWKNATVN